MIAFAGIVTFALKFVLTGLAAWYDLKTWKIPNQITVTGMILAVVLNTAAAGTEGLKLSLLGILVPFVICLVLFVFSMIGTGDIKLYMMIGAFGGPVHAVLVMVFSVLIAAVIAVCKLGKHGNAGERLDYLREFYDRLRQRTGIPAYMEGIPSREEEKACIHMALPAFIALILVTVLSMAFGGMLMLALWSLIGS